ncbi:MAG: hypothetical protein IKR92_03320 [Alphaproteobacteria bacterium]|nr:hypothetical protein [Alphaproteobacteria bacterium]
MRHLTIFMMICLWMCGVNTSARAADDAELDAMIEALAADKTTDEATPAEAANNAVEETPATPAEIAPTIAPQAEAEQPVAAEPTATKEESIEDAVEEVLVIDVFSPDFMASLQVCRKDSESKDGRVFTIEGMRDGKCHLTYGNYVLDVPSSLLGNIHGFDDLNAFLKNKDMAHYKYTPEYTYEGLIFALNACAQKNKFYGVEEEEQRIDATVTRGMSSEYFNDHCEIYLQNELELEFEVQDYGVTCRLPEAAIRATIEKMGEDFTDIIEKYGDLEPMEMHKHKEVLDADNALMYYLQQNNFCRKNNELKQ